MLQSRKFANAQYRYCHADLMSPVLAVQISLRYHGSQRPRPKQSGRCEIVRHYLVRPPRFLLRQASGCIRHAHVVSRPGFAPHEALLAIQTVGERARRAQRVFHLNGRSSGRGHARVVERVGFAPHIAWPAGVGAVEFMARVSRCGDFDVGGRGLNVDGDDFDRYTSGGVKECIASSMD